MNEFSEMNESVRAWLLSDRNPSVKYLMHRDLLRPRASAAELKRLRADIPRWPELNRILALQGEDGGFPSKQKVYSAAPTFSALWVMDRCGLRAGDEPVDRALDFVFKHHNTRGAFSYSDGADGVFPCHSSTLTGVLVSLAGHDEIHARRSLKWIIDHQRFDHRDVKAGGDKEWPYEGVNKYGGCWRSVSCYHGVTAALFALAKIPHGKRSNTVRNRLKAAVEYLRIHRVFYRSASKKRLFTYSMTPFFYGTYRTGMLDILESIARADPTLIKQDWVRDAALTIEGMTKRGKLKAVPGYPTKLLDPLPITAGENGSRFLTFQWYRIKQAFGLIPRIS